jgi:hypothetical protein
MDQNLKPEERELVKLVQFFKKRAEVLIIENKLGDEYKQMLQTCDKLVEQLSTHARNRDIILKEREQLKNMVKDNAACPTCHSNEQLKMIGVEKSEQGWKSNKYKCRRCNIEFVWNTPNNPWDMIPYVEHFVTGLELKLNDENMDEQSRQHIAFSVANMKSSLIRLRPIVEASDLDIAELEAREKEMAEMVNKVKKHLMIEKIKMEN